jgi:hypothetical protein
MIGGISRRRRVAGVCLPMPDLRAFIAVQIVMICYLLPTYRSGGELICGCRVDLPFARNVVDLEPAPFVRITRSSGIALDGRLVGRAGEAGPDGDPKKVQRLHDELVTLRNNYALLHPGEPFLGHLLLEAEKDVPFREVERVRHTARLAGYDEPWYVATKEAVDWTLP